MRDRLTPRGTARRTELLQVAARLFATQGYHPTSVAQIVDALGAGKGVFYWYFSSKEELLEEILRASNQELRRRQQAAITVDDGGLEPDPVRRIELGIHASMAWCDEHRDHFRIIQFAQGDERFRPVLRQNREVAIDDLVRHVKDAIAAGRVVDQEPELVAHAILGVVDQMTRTYVLERGEPVGPVAAAAAAFVRHGLLG